jgi:serine protease AprX
MNEFKILAYYMHESEASLIESNSTNAKITDSFFIGEATQQQIDTLRNNNIIIQILDNKPKELVLTKPAIVEPELEEMDTMFDTVFEVARPQVMFKEKDEESEAPFPRFYKFSTVGPLLEDSKEELKNWEIELIESLEADIYVVRVQNEIQLANLKKLTFVGNIDFYSSKDSNKYISTGIIVERAELQESKIATFDILLHKEIDLPEFLDWLKEKNILIAGAQGAKARVYLLEDSNIIDDIAVNQMVKFVCNYVPPKLHNDVASSIIGVDAYASNLPLANMSYQGEGEIVAIADTGIDVNHPDLTQQLFKTTAWGRPGDVTDTVGHGTHVAGSVAGDGRSSNGKIKGMAPKAKLFFQSLLDGNDGLALPLQLQDLFAEAYKEGARIHNNSWGSSTGSRYTVNSIEVDDFVFNNKDMLLVFSAGNDGNAQVHKNVPEGFVDFLSMGSPASAKNVLTVGASRSTRSKAGLAGMTYSEAWPSAFPYPPYYTTQKVSGDPECLAGFSSRGPCDDTRIKPDVVASGTDIASTKSSLADASSFWGTYPGNPKYAIMGGTSMAAPIVSGIAALVREYFVKTRNHIPSAALLKATIINGCRKLSGEDAILNHADLPNWNQGFGMIDLSKTIPSPKNNFLLYFTDNYKTAATQFVRTGQRMRLQFTVNSPGHWLKICLNYTDIPARALQNNLNVMLDGTGAKWLGNANAPTLLKSLDTVNNVEIIVLDDIAPGTYTIQVVASNLLKGPQDFALVVTSSDTTINIKEI